MDGTRSDGERQESTRPPLDTDVDLVSQLLGHRLRQDDLRKILDQLSAGDRTTFTTRLAELLHRTAALLEVSRRLSESLSLDVVLARLVDLIPEFLDAERCTIFLYDHETDELYTRASTNEVMSEIRFSARQGIAGSVFTSGEPLVIPDAYADSRFNQAIDRKTGFRTRNILCVPIKHSREDGIEVVGVAQVLNKGEGAFDTEDVTLLSLLTSQAAAPLVNARLHEQIARVQKEEAQLLEVTAAISQELQLYPLLRKIMHTVKQILEADRATLFMHDRKTRELWSVVSEDEAMKEIRFPSHLGIAGAVFTSGETVNIPNAYEDPRFNREVDRRTGYKTATILCMPVINKKGERIAVTQVLNKKGGPFTGIDERRLRAFSAQASIAIENAQLFDELVRMTNYNESILGSMSNGVVTVNGEGMIVKVNVAARRILGLPAEGPGAVGHAVQEFFSGPNQWVADSIDRVRQTGNPDIAMDAKLRLGEGEGAEASVNLTVVPLKDPQGADIGCMVMLEDITKEKRLKGTMARYMSKEVADRLLEEGEAALGGKMQHCSVLFTDIRSFTSIAERVGPQETVKLLNEYFSIMVDVILEKGGILDKYIGDAIMAVFGAPFTHPEDADHAVAAAIEMLRALNRFNDRRAAEGQAPVLMGLGINSDEVLSGNIGSLKRMDYTVIGDGVNLASRLEGANKVYGTQILVSEFTVRELKGSYRSRKVDEIRVKGKSQPVGVYEMLDFHDERTFPQLERVLDLYARALAAYRDREWSRALSFFEQALELHPRDSVCRLYRERCGYFLEHPPAHDWDGVWVMKDK